MADQSNPVSTETAVGDSPFVASASLWRRLGEFCLGLSWAAYVALVIFPMDGLTFLRWVMLPIAGLSSLHFFRRAADSLPRLVVDSEGIIDRTSIFGKELRVPWAHVHSVSVSPNGNCYLQLKALDTLREGASLGRRIELLVRRLLRKEEFRISATLLGINKFDLGEHIQKAHFQFERSQLGLGPLPVPAIGGESPST
jgi:hypothetical protein